MAQPSVVNYFNTRKRNAVEDLKSIKARKVLKLDSNSTDVDFESLKGLVTEKQVITALNSKRETKPFVDNNELSGKVFTITNEEKVKPKRITKAPRTRKPVPLTNQMGLQEAFNNMAKKQETVVKPVGNVDLTDTLRTPPSTPKKDAKHVNAMDNLKLTGKELSFDQLKSKMLRSSRLADLKASMNRFKEGAAKLEQLEKKKSSKVIDSPSLKSFKCIELEVHLSPQKIQSPEKAYLSPKKDSSARKNLLHLLSPTKNAVPLSATPRKQLFSPEKQSLTLPYKYRSLAEIFRSIDTVCQIMYNRNEPITFRRLKPAVEELLKRNLTQKHLAQIKAIYPDSYSYKQIKMRSFGMALNQEQWELVIEPNVKQEAMTSDCLLERRRILFNTLVDKVKTFHSEFLLTLDPPVTVSANRITRWHPLFDIEKLPDIEQADLPQPPNEEKFTSGKDVLDKAREMFNCNSRMEQALERLKKAREENPDTVPDKPKEVSSLLKGVPKGLLEKVRQRQAAKALESMTRSDEKDKEVQMYTRLPELARFTRNLFVSEKKSVLPIESVLDKLGNSIRSFMTKSDLEAHLKLLAKELPSWIVFHNIRNCVFIKLNKEADLSIVITKLEKILNSKTTA